MTSLCLRSCQSARWILGKRRIYVQCHDTPVTFVNRAMGKLKEIGWKEWKLFVCDQWHGVGGYLYKGDSSDGLRQTAG